MECPHHAARVLGDGMEPLQFIDARADGGMADTFCAHSSFDLGEAERILIVHDAFRSKTSTSCKVRSTGEGPLTSLGSGMGVIDTTPAHLDLLCSNCNPGTPARDC